MNHDEARSAAKAAVHKMLDAAEDYVAATAEMEPKVKLLAPCEVDDLLRYGPGRSERLAKRGLLPFLTLPDGKIRFRDSDIQAIIFPAAARAAPERSDNPEREGL